MQQQQRLNNPPTRCAQALGFVQRHLRVKTLVFSKGCIDTSFAVKTATRVCEAMASLVDSSAHLSARLKEVGLTQAAVDLIAQAGVDSLSRLAFTVGQPGQPISNVDVEAFLHTALGRIPTLAECSGLKRATFEAHTFLVASLRQQVERSDETAPRKIAYAERTSRMNTLRAELTGISIQGELEPSHRLLDRACAMHEQNAVRYFEPCTCVSRVFEVQGGTKTKELTLEKGSLVVKTNDDKLQSATDTELKLHYAFVRRAISLQFAKIMSFAEHNIWEQFLFDAVHRDAPPGYAKPGISQVLQCDRAAFSRLATLNTPVRQNEDGTYPFGIALLQLRQDPSIALYLSPLAKPQQVQATASTRPAPYNYERPAASKGASKGKGKGRKGKNSPPLPLELRGKYHRTSTGDPICFAFNTAPGCSNTQTKPGEKCPKGYHVCMEPKCQRPHSLLEHSRGS